MEPDHNRFILNDWSDVAFGVKPDGSLLYDLADLPELPIPSRIVIGESFFEIDGWIIAYCDMKKGTLIWATDSFKRWIEEDSRLENKQWIFAISKALQSALTSPKTA